MENNMKRLIRRSMLPTIDDCNYNPIDYDYVNIGVQMVNVNDIVGLDRADEYNDDWTPKKKDRRWQRLYEGYQNGDNIPPIKLIKTPDNVYYVNGDGNHRISVVKTLGLDKVPAIVSEMIPIKEEGTKEGKSLKRLIKKSKMQRRSMMELEMFKSTIEQLGDEGRTVLKTLEEYKFKLEQAGRILKNDPELTQKLVQKRKTLDAAAGQVYSVVFDIENIDITQMYENQQMMINNPGMGAPIDGEAPPMGGTPVPPPNGAPNGGEEDDTAPVGSGGDMGGGAPEGDEEPEEGDEGEEENEEESTEEVDEEEAEPTK